jgi:predicted kinase
MIILVGLPGSGKTTIALNHYNDCVRVNQDELGSRDACVALVKDAIAWGKDIIIDRCNTDIRQRRTWLNLAKHYGIKEVICINVTTPARECYRRACERKEHPTIKNLTTAKIYGIIKSFDKGYEPPTFEEGFTKITVWENI